MSVKFVLLLWKNAIIRRRHWFLTICEVVVPVFLFILVAYARAQISQMGKGTIESATYGQIFNSEAIYQDGYNKKLLYTPKTAFTEDLMQRIRLKLYTADEDTVGFTTENEMLAYIKKQEPRQVFAIVFNGNVQEIPKKLSYDIRIHEPFLNWKINKRFIDSQEYSPDQGAANYKQSGFAALQLLVDTTFVEMTSNKELPVSVTFQEFPFPPHMKDFGVGILYEMVLPPVTLFSFICLLVAVIKRVVEEKASGSKELMKMAGLKSWMLWLSWFIHAFSVNLIAVIVIVFLMKAQLFGANYPPIEHCSATVLFVFLTLYVIASITFCFFISTIFKRPTLATNFGATIWFLGNSLAYAVIQKYENVTFLKYLFCLFPNTAMTFGYTVISKYEVRQIGVNWENIAKTIPDEALDLNMLTIFTFLALDSVIFMLLALYVDAINPGEYGLAQPWHFPISCVYNKIKQMPKIRKNSVQNDVKTDRSTGKLIEQAQHLQTGIRVENLKKKYGRHTAVDGLTMNIYRNQITVLLGYNGAGKSTTMSMITGMIRATSGKILINNRDIKHNTSEIQSSFGLCPQHNLLFTDLTVMEHLIFFGVLRGLTFKAARSEAEHLLHKMDMLDKKNSLARQLSGGMQRKLCLLMALIGDAQVLILDEPTSGMDPESRRFIWDLLLSCRGSRTILITTHFMEEADVLGDWIAIMDHGNLICYGTPFFLKQQIGTGYNLSIVRDRASYKHEEVENMIREYVPHAYLKCENGDTLVYLLPDESKNNFCQLLERLENNKDQMGISNISVSVTTLEDVFLKAGTAADNKNKRDESKKLETRISLTESVNSIDSVTSSSHYTQKMKGLLYKRWYVFVKKLKIQVVQWSIAYVIILITVILSHASSTRTSDSGVKSERLPLDLSTYGNTKVYYGGDAVALADAYGNMVKDQGSTSVRTSDVNNAIMVESLKNFAYYKKWLIVAAEFNSTEQDEPIANVMYSNLALHALPISLNLMMNAILKTYAGEQYSIDVANAPLSGIASTKMPGFWDVEVSISWLMMIPIALFFMVGGFTMFPQQERVSNIVQLQYMCGIRAYLYWLSTYLFDLVVYTIVCILILCIIVFYEFVILDAPIFSGINESSALFLIMLAFALPGILYCYLFSYKNTSAGAFSAFLMVSLFVGIMATLVVQALVLSKDDYYMNLGRDLMYFFLLLPPFGVSYAVSNFARKAAKNYQLTAATANEKMLTCRFDYNPCCDDDKSTACALHKSYLYGNELAVGNELIAMVCSTVLYITILLFLESVYWQRFYEKLTTLYYKMADRNSYDFDREDGSGERGSSRKLDYKPLMEASHLQKTYGRHRAVRNVSFAVKAGDCFGLLGVNGAGKSTTFRMLTGREAVTSGTVNVCTETGEILTLDKNTNEYLRHMGYCPQTNAINQDLTGRQMLRVFACFRGIPEDKIDEEVNKLLKLLDLTEFADKPCGDYSGGNKRKLCFAMALIGTPPLILLDEPTSGVDAAARRKMWELMMNVKNSEKKTSIVLTSHSMDECETLCNTLAIMKKGEIYCQDTVPRLKQKYGNGFTVILKLKSSSEPTDEVDGIESPLSEQFDSETEILLQASDDDSKQVKDVMRSVMRIYKNNLTLKDKHLGLLHYHINDTSKKWSQIFKEIEDLKRKHPVIEDYSISETSLEDVFLSVASAEDNESIDGLKKRRTQGENNRQRTRRL